MASLPLKTGVVLVNLGSPVAPTPPAVRVFLRDFLGDPRVLDMPGIARAILLNLVILPFRPRKSAEAYEKIWSEEGSPLMVHGRALREAVALRLGSTVRVELAMRYGHPSIEAALDRLRWSGCDRVVVFPLYPQFAASTTGSILEEVYREAGRLWNTPFIHVVEPYYDHPGFIDAAAELARVELAASRPEFVLFSYHGLPEKQVRKGDDSGNQCLAAADCCERLWEGNRNCYRAQCFATSRALINRLGLTAETTATTFQSRFGKTPWIQPFTDMEITALAHRGVKRLAVLCPAFVADCLETLEEIGIRGRDAFFAAGGQELTLVPCVNSYDPWADGVVRILHDSAPWLAAG
ncbi:MAG: ferrochelatase [Nitrospirota bacterium]